MNDQKQQDQKNQQTDRPSLSEGLGAWFPIETAPKDGTVIDLWSVYGFRIADARYNSLGEKWLTSERGYRNK